MLTAKQRRYLIEDADKYARKLCLAKAGHRCEKCGATWYLEHHHIVRRGLHWSIRLHPLNGVCLCGACHRWAHAKRVDFMLWLFRYKDRFDFGSAYRPPMPNEPDPTERRNELKAEWERMSKCE